MRAMTEQRDTDDDRHPAPPPPVRLGGTDIYRGAMVILAALAIGGFLIFRGVGSDDSGDTEVDEVLPTDEVDPVETATADTVERPAPAEGAPTDEAAPATTPTGGQEATTGTTAVPAAPGQSAETDPAADPLVTLRPPAEVRVLVLNGGGPQGIAARGTEMLQGQSYITAAPQNASANGPSTIHYADGYEAEALAVAAVFGPGIDALVQPLDPANPPIGDIQGASVIVVIGDDDVIPVA